MRRGFDRKISTDQIGALSHMKQTQSAPGILRECGIKANAIIRNLEGHAGGILSEMNIDLRGAGMLLDVRQCLLDDPVERRFDDDRLAVQEQLAGDIVEDQDGPQPEMP